MRKLFATIAALIGLTLVLLGPPAQADTTIPSFFKTSGWWSTVNPTEQIPNPDVWGMWLYDTFPISCNTTPTDNAFKVIWARRVDHASQLYPASVRRGLAAAASAVTASSQLVLGPTGVSLRNSLSPRFVTWQDAQGQCFPLIQEVIYPSNIVRSGPTVYQWLKENGYMSDAHRKYIVFVQDALTDEDGVVGASYGPTSSLPAGPTNAANYGGNGLYVARNGNYIPSELFYSDWTQTLAHEMTHSLGGVGELAPHWSSGSHVTDCNDVICSGTPGQSTYSNGCGVDTAQSPWYEARASYRLDCNKDDYFNVNNPTWESTRWNTADSSFLWGNPQPPA